MMWCFCVLVVEVFGSRGGATGRPRPAGRDGSLARIHR